MLANAPNTSALWYPYDIIWLDGFFAIQIENIEMKNPERSENKWAASDNMASEWANRPPTSSARKKVKHIAVILSNLSMALLLVSIKSGIS